MVDRIKGFVDIEKNNPVQFSIIHVFMKCITDLHKRLESGIFWSKARLVFRKKGNLYICLMTDLCIITPPAVGEAEF